MYPVTHSIRSVTFIVTTLIVLGFAASGLAREGDEKDGKAIKGAGLVAYVTAQPAIPHSPKNATQRTTSALKSALRPNRDAFDEALDLERRLDQVSRAYWSKQLDSSR
jgi:nitrate/nitrite-specific signal transduction histidine kinase